MFYRFAKILAFISLMEAMVPLLLMLYYVTGIDLGFLYKGISLGSFAVVALFHLNRFPKLVYVSKLYIIFGVVGIVYGMLFGPILWDTVSLKMSLTYVYGIVVPILSISFGVNYAIYRNRYIDNVFRKYYVKSFYICVAVIAFYYILYTQGKIAYWGLGTNIHYYVPFVVNYTRPMYFLLAVSVVLLSGKRATTLNTVTQLIVYYSREISIARGLRLSRLLLLILLFLTASFVFYKKGFFVRFDPLIEVMTTLDFSDEYLVLRAFGGRWEEVLGVLKFVNSNPLSWLIGAGAGVSYSWDVSEGGYREMKNYAHFTPIAYLFRYGIIFTALIYVNMLKLLYCRRSMCRDPFYLCFVASFVASFFGANLLIDVMPWFFYGVISVAPKKYNSNVVSVDNCRHTIIHQGFMRS